MTEEDRDSGAMIEILIRARYLLIYAVSFEVGRVGRRLRVIADARKKQILNWTITSGLELPDGSWTTDRKNIIFLSPVLKVPTELEKEIAVIDYNLMELRKS